ncbi:MAG TPA: AraC family transcriptional regulator [Gemmatimonadaceae bacterium]|nr:AraC family transcriptional regulator [Gemmatimonadaceae bacterium]
MDPGSARPASMVAGIAGRRVATTEVAGYRVVEAVYTKGLSLPRHSHPRPAFSYVARGGFRETSRLGSSFCGAGMMHVRPSEEPHENEFDPNGSRILIVDLPLAPAMDDRRIRRIVGRAAVVQDGVVQTLAGELLWELHHRDHASDLAIEGLVLALLARLVRSTSWVRASAGQGTGATRLERAREFIDAHFSRPLLLTEIASVAGLHPSSLARAFKRRYDVTPWQYQRRRQIAWVKAELARGDRPISVIAHEAGFSDHSHLTRAFRIAEGVVPSSLKRAGSAEGMR